VVGSNADCISKCIGKPLSRIVGAIVLFFFKLRNAILPSKLPRNRSTFNFKQHSSHNPHLCSKIEFVHKISFEFNWICKTKYNKGVLTKGVVHWIYISWCWLQWTIFFFICGINKTMNDFFFKYSSYSLYLFSYNILKNLNK
jgi:hypothetical protein